MVYPGRCILCGHCVAVCPNGALRHSQLPMKRFREHAPADRLPFEVAEQFFTMRRSCRRFKPEPIGKETLEKLLHATRFAPTATNSQNVRFVLIDDTDAIRELEIQTASYYLRLSRQLTNPLSRFAIRVAVGRRAVDAYRFHLPTIVERFRAVLDGEERLFYGAPALVIPYASGLPYMVSANCNLAAMVLMLAAESLELGTCYNGYFLTAMMRAKPIMRAAGIPAGNLPGGAIAVGKPDVVFHRSPPRRKPRITTHGL